MKIIQQSPFNQIIFVPPTKLYFFYLDYIKSMLKIPNVGFEHTAFEIDSAHLKYPSTPINQEPIRYVGLAICLLTYSVTRRRTLTSNHSSSSSVLSIIDLAALVIRSLTEVLISLFLEKDKAARCSLSRGGTQLR